MLGKLLKHELQATARFMWVIYAAMAGMSVCARISFLFYHGDIQNIVDILLFGLLLLWFLTMVAGAAGTLVLLIKRFHQNLLTEEGYLMFTLPADVHRLVLSKLIAAVIWLVGTVAMLGLCLMIALFHSSIITEIWDVIRAAASEMSAYYALNFTAMFLELLLVALLGCADLCLRFYSAMSIGYGFSSHKALLSVAFYGVQYAARQTVGGLIIGVVALVGLKFTGLSVMGQFHVIMGAGLLITLAESAVFYLLTVWNLKNRLNLE